MTTMVRYEMVIDIEKTTMLAASGNVVELVRIGKHHLVNNDVDAGISALADATSKGAEAWSSVQAKGEAKMLLDVFRGMEPDQIYEWIGARRERFVKTGSFFSAEEAWVKGFLPTHIEETQECHRAPAKVLPFRQK